MPLSHPEVCREELEAEEKRRRLVELEGALFVPLSLVDLCVRLVRRLGTLESAFWEGIERHRLPTVLADTLKAARPLKAPPSLLFFCIHLLQIIINIYLDLLYSISNRIQKKQINKILNNSVFVGRVAAVRGGGHELGCARAHPGLVLPRTCHHDLLMCIFIFSSSVNDRDGGPGLGHRCTRPS